MSPEDLQEARDELAELKAVRRARFKRGAITAAGNGSESSQRQPVSFEALDARIRELDREIRMAEESYFGALHIR